MKNIRPTTCYLIDIGNGWDSSQLTKYKMAPAESKNQINKENDYQPHYLICLCRLSLDKKVSKYL